MLITIQWVLLVIGYILLLYTTKKKLDDKKQRKCRNLTIIIFSLSVLIAIVRVVLQIISAI